MRIGLVGAGAAARVLHAPAYLHDPRCHVVGVWSRHQSTAQALANTIGGATAYERLDVMLGVVDAVSVCTPPSHHLTGVQAALRAGVHVLVEKPIAHTLEDLGRIVELARGADVVVEVMRNERRMVMNARIKELVQSHAIGRLLALQFLTTTMGPQNWSSGAAWFRERGTAGGGALLDLGVHKFDLACWIAESDLADVHAGPGARHGDVEEAGATTTVLADGTLVTVTASWIGPEDQMLTVATGDRGVIVAEAKSGRLSVTTDGPPRDEQVVVPWSAADTSCADTVAGFIDACSAAARPSLDAYWDAGTRAALTSYGRASLR